MINIYDTYMFCVLIFQIVKNTWWLYGYASVCDKFINYTPLFDDKDFNENNGDNGGYGDVHCGNYNSPTSFTHLKPRTPMTL